MNTLLHLGALLASAWLAVEMWTTYAERLLGVVGVAVFLYFLAGIWYAAQKDYEILTGENNQEG